MTGNKMFPEQNSFGDRRNLGSIRFCLEKDKKADFVCFDVSSGVKFLQTRRLDKRFLDQMVESKINICPVWKCLKPKEDFCWVCPDCHEKSFGILTKIVRRYVTTEKLKNRSESLFNEKGELKKKFDKGFSDFILEKIRVDKLSKEEIFDQAVSNFLIENSFEKKVLQDKIEEIEKNLKKEGFVPFHVWNELFDKFTRFERPKIPMEERSKQGIMFFLKNIVPRESQKGLDMEKTMSNLMTAIEKHKKNLKGQ